MFVCVMLLALCALTVTTHASVASVPLQHAVIANNLPAIRQILVRREFDINTVDGIGRTALHYAARLGHREVVELLLDHNAKAKLRDNEGKLPFTHAVENAAETDTHAAIAAILLVAMSGVDGYDEQGWPPLNWAVMSQDRALVQQLIDKGADIKGGHRQNAIDVALLMEDTEMLGELLPRATEVDIKDRYGDTVLVWAAKNGYLEMVELLLQRGAKVGVKTALMEAVKNGHLEIVELLLQRGAEVNVKDWYADTALVRAAKNGHLEMVELLLQRGAEVNDKDRYDDTALVWAAKRGHLEMVELLLQRGAKVGVETAIWEAVKNRHLEMVELLLPRGAKVVVITALMEAVKNGHLEIVELLLQRGAEVNDKDRYYCETPLWLAAKHGHLEIVELLLPRGAKVGVKTALMEAVKNRHLEMVKLLLQRGAQRLMSRIMMVKQH